MTDTSKPHLRVTTVARAGICFVSIVNNPVTPDEMRELARDLLRKADQAEVDIRVARGSR